MNLWTSLNQRPPEQGRGRRTRFVPRGRFSFHCDVPARRLRLAVLTITTFAVFTTCGLEVGVFLFAPREDLIRDLSLPSRGTANSIPTVLFFNNPSNDVAGFLGYEIYYKFYNHSVADEQFADDRDFIRDSGFPRPDIALSGRGYRRMTTPGALQPPLIRINNADEPLPIEVAFFPFGTPDSPFDPFDAFVRWPVDLAQTTVTTLRLRRNLSGGELRPFVPLSIDLENYQANHSDVIQVEDFSIVLGTPDFALALFVFAYGFNPANPGSAIYSEAVGLMYASMIDS